MSYFNSNFFGIAAAILSIIATAPYIRSIIKGQTKPSGASWWTWTLISLVTLVSSYFAGAPWQVLVLPAWLCVLHFTISILSLKRGDNNWDLINKISVTVALLGVGLWLITGQPIIALIISIFSDFLASVPNFRHVWIKPYEEDRLAWTLGWGSAILEVLAVRTWKVGEAGFPIYFLFMMSATLVLIWRPALKNLFVRNI